MAVHVPGGPRVKKVGRLDAADSHRQKTITGKLHEWPETFENNRSPAQYPVHHVIGLLDKTTSCVSSVSATSQSIAVNTIMFFAGKYLGDLGQRQVLFSA
jgi:hypothetical protein